MLDDVGYAISQLHRQFLALKGRTPREFSEEFRPLKPHHASPTSTSRIDAPRIGVTRSPSQIMPMRSAKRMLVSRSAATIGIGATVKAPDHDPVGRERERTAQNAGKPILADGRQESAAAGSGSTAPTVGSYRGETARRRIDARCPPGERESSLSV